MICLKKKILAGFLIVALFSGAIWVMAAGGISPGPTDAEVSVSAERKAALSAFGLNDVDVAPTFCNGQTCTVHIFRQNAVDQNITFSQKATEAENLTERNAAITKKLQVIADAQIERQAKLTEKKLDAGTITIT